MLQDFGEENSIINQLKNSPDNIDRRDIKAAVVDNITAGVETVGNTVGFAVALLASNHSAKAKLQRELDELLPNWSQAVEESALHGMTYLRSCLQESYRICPTACQIARILEEDTEVSGGFVLPKHSVVLCHQRIAAMQEDNFTR